MTKGKPWTIEEETELRKLVDANIPIDEIAKKFGKNSSAILVKCNRLGLDVKAKNNSLSLPLPEELPTAEEALKILAGALQTARIPGISRVEVNRLNAVATLAKVYRENLADFIHSRELEVKLLKMEEKYDKLLAQVSKDDENKRSSEEVGNSPK